MINFYLSSESTLDSALLSERSQSNRDTKTHKPVQNKTKETRTKPLKNFEALIKPTPFKKNFVNAHERKFPTDLTQSHRPLTPFMSSSLSQWHTEPDHFRSFSEDSTIPQYLSTSPDSNYESTKSILKKGVKSRFSSSQRVAKNLKVTILEKSNREFKSFKKSWKVLFLKQYSNTIQI